MRVSLLHPFSAKSIGLHENDLYYSHSKPQEKAMLKLQAEGSKVAIEYFTGSLFPYSKNIKGIKKRFWPITKPLLKNRHTWRRQYSWFNYIYNFVNAPDITIINMSGHGSKYCFKLAKLLRKKGKPYIAMIGGIHLSTEGLAKEYFQNAHHIIVHTEVQKKQMLPLETFKGLEIRVMPLGVDTDVFTPTQKDSEDIELLFVGRITRLKQIELCLETLAFLLKNQKRSLSLTIVGPVSDSTYFSELKLLATQLGIAEQLHFLGTVEQKDLVPYFQKANLLLLPSAHESFGMVIVEAMACGTPVVALAGSGGPDEIIEDGVTGILATKETFAERVLEFVQSEEMESVLSVNARTIVEQKWSLEQTEDALRESINQVFVNL